VESSRRPPLDRSTLNQRFRTVQRPMQYARPVSSAARPLSQGPSLQPGPQPLAAKPVLQSPRPGLIQDFGPAIVKQPGPQPQPSAPVAAAAPLQTLRPVLPISSIPSPATRNTPNKVDSVTMPRQIKSNVLQRQIVQKTALPATTLPLKKKATKAIKIQKKTLALAAGCMVLVFAGAAGGLLFFKNSQAKVASSMLASDAIPSTEDLQTNADPVEKPPTLDDHKKYRTPPDEPRYMRISSIQSMSRIKSVNLKTSGSLGMPTNIFDTAWYKGSAKPGSEGVVVINAHSSGRSAPGAFYNLEKLKPGNTIEIIRGDEKVYTYTVVKTAPYTANPAGVAAAMLPAVPGKPGLNLVGQTNSKTPDGSSNDGLIVYAVQN